MIQRRQALALLLLTALLAGLPAAYAAQDVSPNLTTSTPPLYGRRLLVHDTNGATSRSYYAALYSDSSYNLQIAVYEYTRNQLLFTQEIVAAADWIGSLYGNYVLSDCHTAMFYLIYQASVNTLAVKRLDFNYTAYQPYNLIVTPVVVFSSTGIVYNSGLDATVKDDGTLWVSWIYQTTILNARVVRINTSGVVALTMDQVLNFNQIWSIQLARANDHVYAWVAGIALQLEGGRIYDAEASGAVIYTSAFIPAYSSAISLTSGAMAIVYQATNNWIGYIIYDAPSLPVESGIQYHYVMTDVSAFTMPNEYFGFYFTTAYGLSAMYYSSDGWSAFTSIRGQTGGYIQAPISADRESNIEFLGAHPAVWVYVQIPPVGQYYNLISVDLQNVNSISLTTVMTSRETTYYRTSTTWSTTYLATSKVSTTNTISMSGLMSSSFIMPMIMLVMFLVVLPAVLGMFLGFLGLTVGVVAGAIIGFIFGQLPLWVLLVTVLLITVVFVVYRGSEARSGVG